MGKNVLSVEQRCLSMWGILHFLHMEYAGECR
ncbi:hypothetical protein JOE09_003195 [Pantoea coffeiphila]|nr:hypothetical protein [Pantoea coffeiphila]